MLPIVLLSGCGFGLLSTPEKTDDTSAATTDSPGEPDSDSTGADDTAPTETGDTTPVDTNPDDTGPDDTGVTTPAGPGIYTLGESATAWEMSPLNPDGSADAPVAPIQAAFGLSDVGIVVVLTGGAIHIMDAATLVWLGSDARDRIFPEVSGLTVSVAVSVPDTWGTGDGAADVYLIVGDEAYVYSYDIAGNQFTLTTTAELKGSWDETGAPDTTALSWGWLATDEGAGWATPGSPRTTCGADADVLGPYMAFFGGEGDVYLYDSGYCNEFVSSVAVDSFSVFQFPGAPDPVETVAMDWTGADLVAFVQ